MGGRINTPSAKPTSNKVTNHRYTYVHTYPVPMRRRLWLYAKVWFSFRVLANLAGKTHKSAPNLVQIEQNT